MDLSEVKALAIEPAYALLPARMESDAATVLLLAIGLQESRFTHRRQIGGPARGFWQFESGGGVRGVLTHPTTRTHAKALCEARGVPASVSPVYSAIEQDDVLAAGFARLLLWSDPLPLPAIDRTEAAWNLYMRTWRPGRPRKETWDAFHQQAVEATA